jgi:opacity protein-like surface antigen
MNVASLCTVMGVLMAAPAAWGEGDAVRTPAPKEEEAVLAIDPLPRTLVEEEPLVGAEEEDLFEEASQVQPPRTGFSLGPRAGYLRARDADRGTWFGGVQARLRLSPAFALEGSIEFHQDEFADGSVEVTQYPVQATALLYPFPELPFQVYVLGGAGWYFTRFSFEDELEDLDDETDSVWGIHVGVGAELFAGDAFSLDADVRYIFLDESDDVSGGQFGEFDDDEMDFWQITLALNFRF